LAGGFGSGVFERMGPAAPGHDAHDRRQAPGPTRGGCQMEDPGASTTMVP